MLRSIVLPAILCVLAPATGVDADSSAPVNPASLFQPIPADLERVDARATLSCRIKAEPVHFNPILMFTAVDAQFDYLLWDRPFVLNAALEWELNGAVAERYEESEDHLSATLTLKPNLRWHDGQAYTAEDVAWSWARIMDDRVVCRKARTGADQLAGCEATGPRTVRYTFKEALPTNKWNVDFPILPKHVYEPLAAADPTLEQSDACVAANRGPIGNGPYRLAEWVSGQHIALERWEDYPGEKPAFKRILFKVIPDNNAALLAFETGQIDEMELTPQQFARETDGERFASMGVKGRAEQWTTYYIGWNVDGSVPFLADARVRRAMCQAVNMDLIIERVFFGLFARSKGLFHPGSWVGEIESEPYGFDPAAAARLLDDAGWRVDEDDGWRYKTIESADGTARRLRAGFALNMVQGSQTSPKIADVLQADLRKIGVDMSSQVLEWAVFNERNFKREFEAFLSAWTPGPEPDEAWNLFHSQSREGGRNYTGYANAEVDRLFERGRRDFSDAVRRGCYRRIGEIIHAEAPYTFLVNAPTLWAFNKDLRGVAYSPRGPINFYPGVRSWWKPVKR
jgi:peptide/nickel transport system substrate-binding protein